MRILKYVGLIFGCFLVGFILVGLTFYSFGNTDSNKSNTKQPDQMTDTTQTATQVDNKQDTASQNTETAQNKSQPEISIYNNNNIQINTDQVKTTSSNKTKELILGKWSNYPFKQGIKRDSTIEFFDDGTFFGTDLFDDGTKYEYGGKYAFSGSNRIKINFEDGLGIKKIYNIDVDITDNILTFKGKFYTESYTKNFFNGENKWVKIK